MNTTYRPRRLTSTFGPVARAATATMPSRACPRACCDQQFIDDVLASFDAAARNFAQAVA